MSLTKRFLESTWETDEASIRAAQDEIDLAYERLVIELESQPEGEENHLADLYDPADNFDGRR